MLQYLEFSIFPKMSDVCVFEMLQLLFVFALALCDRLRALTPNRVHSVPRIVQS